jgi:hypothetical protein
MPAERLGNQRQEIELVKRNAAGVIVQHKKITVVGGKKTEEELEV